MIVCTCFKNQKDTIQSIKVDGHAGNAPYGYDIVCAAVSALFQSLVIGLDVIKCEDFDIKVESGDSEINLFNDAEEKANVLTQIFHKSLEAIEAGYPECLNVKEVICV